MSISIVLGMGNNVDYEIKWDKRVINQMIKDLAIDTQDINKPKRIDTKRDFLISILYYFTKGIGGEDYVNNPAVLDEFCERFNKKVTLGGTSVRAGIAMSNIGVSSFNHLVTINEHVERLLPKSSKYLCSNEHNTIYPHVIIQYREGDCVEIGGKIIQARNSNRIIYVNDPDNSRMKIHEDLKLYVKNSKVFLISGLNALKTKEKLIEKIKELKKIIANKGEDTLIFCEDAGYHYPGMSEIVGKELFPLADIVSMNEDEFQGYFEEDIDLLNAEDVYNKVLYLKDLYKIKNIVVHTKWWSVSHTENNLKIYNCMKSGVDLATTRFVYGDDYDIEDFKKTKELDRCEAGIDAVIDFTELNDKNLSCCSVAKVDQNNGTTIGLGDTFVGGFIAELSTYNQGE